MFTCVCFSVRRITRAGVGVTSARWRRSESSGFLFFFSPRFATVPCWKNLRQKLDRFSPPVCKQLCNCTTTDDKRAEATLGISRQSTSERSEKPQCQASRSKSFYECVTERKERNENRNERRSGCVGRRGQQGMKTDCDRTRIN